MEAGQVEKNDHGHEAHSTNIQIDRVHYKVTAETMTGQQLRALPTPPIPPDRDLFMVVPGGPDEKIENSQPVELRNGLRFFTAPGQINPGLQGL